MISSDVPPAEMVEGVKALPIRGRLGLTTSKSATVQVPLGAQTGLVFVTPAGGEIEAVLVTPV
jgi:hypothetical protein